MVSRVKTKSYGKNYCGNSKGADIHPVKKPQRAQNHDIYDIYAMSGEKDARPSPFHLSRVSFSVLSLALLCFSRCLKVRG